MPLHLDALAHQGAIVQSLDRILYHLCVLIFLQAGFLPSALGRVIARTRRAQEPLKQPKLWMVVYPAQVAHRTVGIPVEYHVSGVIMGHMPLSINTQRHRILYLGTFTCGMVWGVRALQVDSNAFYSPPSRPPPNAGNQCSQITKNPSCTPHNPDRSHG